MCSCLNKLVLIIVNAIFALVGAALVGVSLWVIFSQDTLFQVVKVATQNVNVDDATLNSYIDSPSVLTAAAWVLVAFGGLSLVIGLTGCIGAVTENSCLLIIYAVLVTVILLAEIAFAVVAIVFKAQIEADISPRLITLQEKHFLPWNMRESGSDVNKIITNYINYMQVSLQCCGIQNVTDITANTTMWSNSNGTYNGSALAVPVTCCPMKSNRGDLLGKSDWANVANYLSDPNCPNTANNYMQIGCYDQINKLINTYTLPIIICAVVVGLFEILLIVMACGLVQKKRSGDGETV